MGTSQITGILTQPKRTIKNVYSASTAVPAQNAIMNGIVEQFASSIKRNKPRWDNIICIGDAYARGKYPFLQPNEDMAIVCYRVAETCPDSTIISTARSRIMDTENNPVENCDRLGSPMSCQYGNSICKMAVSYIKSEKPKPNKISMKLKAVPPPLPRIPIPNIPIDITIRPDIFPTGTPNPIEEEVIRRPPRRNGGRRRRRDIAGGSQNTHDHGVTSSTKINIKEMKDGHEGPFRDHSIVVDDVMRTCREVVDDPNSIGVSSDTYSDVYDVVTSITNDEYSDTGLTQIQILDLALKKIRTLDKEVGKGVNETLCKRLATGIEDGKVVCATGKMARIVSVFEGVDDTAQKAVSIAYVEKEIAQMAINVRNEYLEKIGPIARKAYETDQSVPEYGVEMSRILTERVNEEYVNKLNMSPSVITPLVELYSGSF